MDRSSGQPLFDRSFANSLQPSGEPLQTSALRNVHYQLLAVRRSLMAATAVQGSRVYRTEENAI